MNIEQSISQLLYRHQCVTVPGFGAFLSEIKSAQLNQNTHSFYPPKKQISFNPNIKNNDGLLANYVGLTEKISYNEAVNQIANHVQNWNSDMAINQKISIANVGDLYLSTDKNIVFTPSESLNYFTSSFGLNSFVSPLVKREIFEKQLETLEEKETIIQLFPERKNYSFLKYAAVLLLATGIGTYGGIKFYENKIKEDTLIVETNVQKKIENKIQEATFFISNPLPAVTLTVKTEKLNYHVVAGAFRQEKNAQNALNALLQKGYKARRVPQSHGLFPVVYGSFSSYIDAKKMMNNIQKNHNQEVWMLIKEL